MRFFFVACLFGIVVASLGCMTKNWSSPLFDEPNQEENIEDDFPVWESRGIADEIFGSGIEPKAKEIERRLGYKSR